MNDFNNANIYQRQLGFGEAVKKALLENYCNFQGRASRSEYWWFALFTFIVGAVISLIFGTGTTGRVINGIFELAMLLPSLGLTVRRLHDVGKSGWWFFIGFIPLIGWIWLIWLLATPSQATPNEYGPEPNVVMA